MRACFMTDFDIPAKKNAPSQPKVAAGAPPLKVVRWGLPMCNRHPYPLRRHHHQMIPYYNPSWRGPMCSPSTPKHHPPHTSSRRSCAPRVFHQNQRSARFGSKTAVSDVTTEYPHHQSHPILGYEVSYLISHRRSYFPTILQDFTTPSGLP